MSERRIGIIGGGRIARIILAGWARADSLPSGVVVSDSDGSVLERLRTEFPSVTVTCVNREAAAQDDVLFALHPPAFPSVLEEIRNFLAPNAVLVSLAPKWTMSRICATLGGFGRLARVIPNAPSIVNKGYNPVSFSEALTAGERARVRSLFEPLGRLPEVREGDLEAFAIIAAMGPTYLWYQMYQLVDLGRGFGLSPEAAMEAVDAMVTGAVSTMASAGLAPEEVTDLIPVKPLASLEPTVKQSYVEVLSALHKKLTA